VTASPGRRLGAYLLDALLIILTLGIGWLIWFIFTAMDGQTPAKKLLGLYIIKADATRAGGGYTWLREFLIKGLVTGLINLIACGVYSLVAGLWCTWDKDRQCLWDKMSGTFVAWSPSGYKPLTAGERVAAGMPPLLTSGAASYAQTGATASVSDQLRELGRLRDEGVITAEEYEERHKKLVDRL
jgi:uncharacterized RDD family membrane protein YckC